MTPEPELRSALSEVYEAFGGYPPPKALEAPSYRNPERLLARLTAKPLTQLTGDDIGPYMGWAMTTVGGVEDYKHFLPRILELSALERSVHVGGDPELLAGKIMYGGFPSWPNKERVAILTAYDEAWRQALRTSPDEIGAEEWLLGLIELGEPIEARLAAWVESQDPTAGLHLAEAVNLEAFRRQDSLDAVLDGARTDYAVWLTSLAVRQRLERLILEVGDDETWRVAQALGLPTSMQAGLWRG